MTRRIAILLTNDDDSAFAQAFENDGRKVARLLGGARPDWQCEVIGVAQGTALPGPHDHDAVVITGSPASVNDAALPWLAPLFDFIRTLHALQRPAVGLCFGHQAMATALGGQVQRHPGGWGLGLTAMDWPQPQPWMQPAQPRLHLMAAHNEQVTQLPPGARVLAGNTFCPVGAFQLGDHLLAVQHHPEMPTVFMAALLDHLATTGAVDADTLAAARDSLDGPNEGALLAQWICRFLEAAWAGQASPTGPRA